MPRILTRSVWLQLLVTLVAVIGFVLIYEITMSDSREAAPTAPVDPTAPAAGARLRFSATAYCKGTTTASGVRVRTGIAAADPALLPVGSVVNVTTDDPKYNGVYTIMDTGPKVQGRILDLYMWSCYEALDFGRKPIDVEVLRLGWNPTNSTPSLVERLFRRREAAAAESNTRSANGATGATDADGPTDETDRATEEAEGAIGVGAPSEIAPSDAPLAPAPPPPTVAPVVNVP